MSAPTAPAVSRALKAGFIASVAIVISLYGWVFLGSISKSAHNAAQMQLVFESRSWLPAEALKACLGANRIYGLALHGGKGPVWRSSSDSWNISRAKSPSRQTQIDVIEVGGSRILRFYTLDGRPMHASERTRLDTCLAGSPS